MNLIKPIVAGALMAIAGVVHAEETLQLHLCINFTNGTTAYINLEDGYDNANRPTLDTTPTSLTVTLPQTGADPAVYTYDVTAVDNFYFEQRTPTGIADAKADSKPVINVLGGGIVSVSGAEASDVYVFDVKGRAVNVEKNQQGGATVVSLSGVAPGVYVISSKSATLKITKK